MRPSRVAGSLALLVLAAAAAAPAAAQQPVVSATRLAAARRLMAATRVRESVEGGFESLRAAQQLMPGAAALGETMSGVLREQLSWAVLEPEYAHAYAETFTERELRALVAFYESPTGRVLVAKMPAVTARVQAASLARVQGAMPELMQQLQSGVPAAPPR